jgi:hypothetical protein
MVFLHNFREVPKLRWPSHIFGLERVINSLHMLEGFSCTLELLVLSFSSGKHPFSNNGVFNILMNCLVNVFELFNGNFNYFVFEILITIILPNPVAS